MKRENSERLKENDKEKTKYTYVSPELEVTYVEMEQGFAAGSAGSAPGMTGGNTDAVSTEWDSRDDSSIDSGWLSK
ncbi:MAG: hypothetical protein LBE39_11750 [Flavobacteriaceae bacterium]|jgi:hypothetical protein|nr:hypothetical protein [Flavobacteriaceae bacterium]